MRARQAVSKVLLRGLSEASFSLVSFHASPSSSCECRHGACDMITLSLGLTVPKLPHMCACPLLSLCVSALFMRAASKIAQAQS